jgi:hypothetical protein
MTSFRKLLAICVVLSATLALTPRSYANSLVYESVPDLTVAPLFNSYCSDCVVPATGLPFGQEILDPFTLTGSYLIDQVNFVTTDNPFFPGGSGLDGVTVNIWNSDHSSVIFSQDVNAPTLIEDVGATFILSVALSSLSLSAGDYWISFYDETLGVPSFSGGNGGAIGTNFISGQVNDLCNAGGACNENLGYQLYGNPAVVPVPAALPLFAGGLGLLGWMARRRRGQAAHA